jgi:hypothetical protein
MKSTTMKRSAIALAASTVAFSAMAVEFAVGEGVSLRINGTVTAGTALRTESADPDVLGTLSCQRAVWVVARVAMT